MQSSRNLGFGDIISLCFLPFREVALKIKKRVLQFLFATEVKKIKLIVPCLYSIQQTKTETGTDELDLTILLVQLFWLKLDINDIYSYFTEPNINQSINKINLWNTGSHCIWSSVWSVYFYNVFKSKYHKFPWSRSLCCRDPCLELGLASRKFSVPLCVLSNSGIPQAHAFLYPHFYKQLHFWDHYWKWPKSNFSAVLGSNVRQAMRLQPNWVQLLKSEAQLGKNVVDYKDGDKFSLDQPSGKTIFSK